MPNARATAKRNTSFDFARNRPTAARTALHLVRKAAKPFCLWLAEAKQAAAEAQADRYMELRAELVDLEIDMRKHAVVLAVRRKRIQAW